MFYLSFDAFFHCFCCCCVLSSSSSFVILNCMQMNILEFFRSSRERVRNLTNVYSHPNHKVATCFSLETLLSTAKDVYRCLLLNLSFILWTKKEHIKFIRCKQNAHCLFSFWIFGVEFVFPLSVCALVCAMCLDGQQIANMRHRTKTKCIWNVCEFLYDFVCVWGNIRFSDGFLFLFRGWKFTLLCTHER